MADELELVFPGGSVLKLGAELERATVGTVTSYPLDLVTDGDARLRIDNVGNVGIGTGAAALANQLEVKGSLASTSLSVTDNIETDRLSVNGAIAASSLKATGQIKANQLEVSGAIAAASLNVSDTVRTDQLESQSIAISGDSIIQGALTTQNSIVVNGTLALTKRHSADTADLDWTLGTTDEDTPTLVVSRISKPDNAQPDAVMPLAITWEGAVGIGTIPKKRFSGPNNTRVATPLSIRATGNAEGLITFEDAAGSAVWHINQNYRGHSGLNFVETGIADGRLFIAAGGNVGVGTTTPNFKLDVRGDIGSNTTRYHSDIRWKHRVEPITDALSKVLQLQGVSFEWRVRDYPDMNFSAGKQFGLIAQKVEKIVPEVVAQDKEGYQSLDYVKLIALLIEAIKELNDNHTSFRQSLTPISSTQTIEAFSHET